MTRVASLYLPQLAIERLRRLQRPAAPPERAWSPAPILPPIDDDPGACSVPRGGGWRPGARWAHDGAAKGADIEEQIARLPAHQRPPIRSSPRHARELLNKSENERSGVLSTAMSFLGLYRDPVVAKVTSNSSWRIADLVDAEHPVTLYLVVPPSDISRTKPLIRLLLNQIGRRLTEELRPAARRHRVLLMLDEFPALGRLDFFESALAFMAGYGLKAFLIAQSLNQIEKAYGANNAILDNCHVRVSFATNDERTAKRISDALGTATEMRAMKNYAGHRLSPWLGHLMVSRTETARALLTPGEIMQLPPDDEIVMVAGVHPIRARKVRYYRDRRLASRIGSRRRRRRRRNTGPMFVRFWLVNNPPLPDTALPAAQAMGKERWERFIETLNRRMEFGPRLKNEIVEDVGPRPGASHD